MQNRKEPMYSERTVIIETKIKSCLIRNRLMPLGVNFGLHVTLFEKESTFNLLLHLVVFRLHTLGCSLWFFFLLVW